MCNLKKQCIPLTTSHSQSVLTLIQLSTKILVSFFWQTESFVRNQRYFHIHSVLRTCVSCKSNLEEASCDPSISNIHTREALRNPMKNEFALKRIKNNDGTIFTSSSINVKENGRKFTAMAQKKREVTREH